MVERDIKPLLGVWIIHYLSLISVMIGTENLALLKHVNKYCILKSHLMKRYS